MERLQALHWSGCCETLFLVDRTWGGEKLRLKKEADDHNG